MTICESTHALPILCFSAEFSSRITETGSLSKMTDVGSRTLTAHRPAWLFRNQAARRKRGFFGDIADYTKDFF